MRIAEREQCRKDILPDRIFLGHGVNNDMTVIVLMERYQVYTCIYYETAFPRLFFTFIENFYFP